MTDMRKDLPPLPRRWSSRPIDHRGYPVPWFVTVKDDDGRWDFRIVDPTRKVDAVRHRRCWLCGEPLGVHGAFVIGPMCAINRTTAEPPVHLDCARYAVAACPFLARPRAQRRTAGIEDMQDNMPGVGLQRNPGACLIWSTRQWRWYDPTGRRSIADSLVALGDPTSCEWYAEGRPATRAEIMASIESGLPALRSVAEDEGPAAVAALERMTEAAMIYLPEPAI